MACQYHISSNRIILSASRALAPESQLWNARAAVRKAIVVSLKGNYASRRVCRRIQRSRNDSECLEENPSGSFCCWQRARGVSLFPCVSAKLPTKMKTDAEQIMLDTWQLNLGFLLSDDLKIIFHFIKFCEVTSTLELFVSHPFFAIITNNHSSNLNVFNLF